MKLAAIDIGSNSIKLVVVDAASADSFAVLARDKETVRLGHETLSEGYLSPAAVERAAECVKRFRSIAEARGATRVLAIATVSVRAASNAQEFIDEIESRTGVRVEVLSGIEEARLIGPAAARGCCNAGASLVNVDIGGGSTEISLVRNGVPVALYSVRLSAVGLTERFISSDPPKAKELRALREEIGAALERPARELRDAGWQRVTGTSGTIIAIGEALRAQGAKQKSQGAQPAGAEIVLSRLERFNERMAGMTQGERRGVHGVSAQRAEIIVVGGQILEAVRDGARERLETIIAESPLAELRQKFLSRLEKVGSGGVRPKKGGKGKGRRRGARPVSFRQAGREVIESRVNELREFSNSLHHPFEVESLHRMRIAAKRLRYALELFAPAGAAAFRHARAR